MENGPSPWREGECSSHDYHVREVAEGRTDSYLEWRARHIIRTITSVEKDILRLCHTKYDNSFDIMLIDYAKRVKASKNPKLIAQLKAISDFHKFERHYGTSLTERLQSSIA